ncbi:hypothetical protein M8494_14460 [Serratia ureilytica]
MLVIGASTGYGQPRASMPLSAAVRPPSAAFFEKHSSEDETGSAGW